jgi:hypothetical protein
VFAFVPGITHRSWEIHSLDIFWTESNYAELIRHLWAVPHRVIKRFLAFVIGDHDVGPQSDYLRIRLCLLVGAGSAQRTIFSERGFVTNLEFPSVVNKLGEKQGIAQNR